MNTPYILDMNAQARELERQIRATLGVYYIVTPMNGGGVCVSHENGLEYHRDMNAAFDYYGRLWAMIPGA